MKRMLSCGDLSLKATATDNADHSDDHTSSQQRAKRSRKAKAGQSSSIDDTISQVATQQPDKLTATRSTVGTTFETNMDILREQLKDQQSHIDNLSRKVDDVLLCLQHICQFLGLENVVLDAGETSAAVNVTGPLAGDTELHSGMAETDCGSVHANTSESASATADIVEVVVPSKCNTRLSHTASNAGQDPRIKQNNDCGTLKDIVLEAIFKDSVEREKRAKSIIVSGIRVHATKNDYDLVKELLSTEFNFDPGAFKCFRLGRSYPDHIQPLLVTLMSKDDAAWLVASSGLLRKSHDQWTRDRVFINRNLSREERRTAYELRCKRRANQLTMSNNVSGSTAGAPKLLQTGGSSHGLGGTENGESGRPIRVIMNAVRRRRNNMETHLQLDNEQEFPYVGRSTMVVDRTESTASPSTTTSRSQSEVPIPLLPSSQLNSLKNIQALSTNTDPAESNASSGECAPTDSVSVSISVGGAFPSAGERRL